LAVARHLPHGRSPGGDRHLNFHGNRDNLVQAATAELRSAGVEILFESGVDDSGNAWVQLLFMAVDLDLLQSFAVVGECCGYDPAA